LPAPEYIKAAKQLNNLDSFYAVDNQETKSSAGQGVSAVFVFFSILDDTHIVISTGCRRLPHVEGFHASLKFVPPALNGQRSIQLFYFIFPTAANDFVGYPSWHIARIPKGSRNCRKVPR
jgi:hypothetical protein